MKLWDILKTSASNLWRNKGRTFLTVIAVFIGAFTISLTSSVNSGVNDYIDRQVSIFGKENKSVQIIKKSEMSFSSASNSPKEFKENTTTDARTGMENLTSADIEKISKIEGLSNPKLIKNATADYIEGKNGKKFEVTLNKIDENTDVKLDIKTGADKISKNEVVISDDFVEVFGFKNAQEAIGTAVKLRASNQISNEKKIFELKVAGVMNKSLVQSGMVVISGEIFDEIANFQLENLPEEYKNSSFAATAQVDEAWRTDEKISEIKAKGEKAGFSIVTYADQIKSFKDVINGITGGLIVFGAIALLAASFGIINTLYMSVRERTREIGLMKAMGLSNRKVFALFSAEAILIGVIGSVLGILAAKGVGSVLNNFASQSFLKGLEGFNLTLFTLENSLAIVAIVAFIAFIAGALPSRSASRKDPIEALRYE